MKKVLLVLFSVLLVSSYSIASEKKENKEQMISSIQVPHNAVVAHRGASQYVPEETGAAYIMARQMGADYLECDLQRTKDGVLIALHDNNLKRTSDVEKKFPKRADDPISKFTLAELKTLDAGSWFNKKFPNRARDSYKGAKICTLDEMINIAEGKLANGDPDLNDNGNRPGIYIETKVANLFPGMEKDIYEKLKTRGWLGSSKKDAPTGFDTKKNVGVQYTKARTILQTFEPTSLPLLNKYMPDTPKCFLIWLYTEKEAKKWGIEKIDQNKPGADLSKTYGPLRKDTPAKQAEDETRGQFAAKWEVASRENFKMWLQWAKNNGADYTGPGARLADFNDPVKGAQSYMDTVKPWMNKMTHDLGMSVHAYTIDEATDFKAVTNNGVDGVFTNKTDAALNFYGKKLYSTKEEILKTYHW
ncbi:MAG: glycerophosphodiester phosphodiesterase [Desulfobacteraceae bacterium]|nr:glycerophosphodiester phosphodiesterase [Desulfobacteraceae bacterium]